MGQVTWGQAVQEDDEAAFSAAERQEAENKRRDLELALRQEKAERERERQDQQRANEILRNGVKQETL